LLEVRIKLEQRRVVRLFLRLLGRRGGGIEPNLEIVFLGCGSHEVAVSSVEPTRVRGACATLTRTPDARPFGVRYRAPARRVRGARILATSLHARLPMATRQREKMSAVDTAWLRMDRPDNL